MEQAEAQSKLDALKPNVSSQKEYEQQVKAVHAGIMSLPAVQDSVRSQLAAALSTGLKLEDICIVVCWHNGRDPFSEDFMGAQLENQGLEVGIIFVVREKFVEELKGWTWTSEGNEETHPYSATAKNIAKTPKPGHFYLLMFAEGLCSVNVVKYETGNEQLPTMEITPIPTT